MGYIWKLQMTVILIGVLISSQNKVHEKTDVLNCLKEIFTTLYHPLSLLLVCSSHSEISQPYRLPGILYNPQLCMYNCQTRPFFLSMFDGCRVGFLFQTSLYAKEPTAE